MLETSCLNFMVHVQVYNLLITDVDYSNDSPTPDLHVDNKAIGNP